MSIVTKWMNLDSHAIALILANTNQIKPNSNILTLTKTCNYYCNNHQYTPQSCRHLVKSCFQSIYLEKARSAAVLFTVKTSPITL
jgi:hypothetical protein